MEKEVLNPEQITKKVIDSMSSGKTQVEAMEELILPKMSDIEKGDYYKIKETLSTLRKELEQKAGYVSIIKKVENLIKSGGDLKNNALEGNIRELFDSLIIAFERKALIVETANDLTTGKLVFSDNLKKYILTNFHRTICEIVVKLFLEPLPAILRYTKEAINSSNLVPEEKAKKIKSIDERKKKLDEGNLDLMDLVTIMSTMEKNTAINVNIANMIKEYFGYVEGKGFLIRNNTAHERTSFNNIDTKEIYNKVIKANSFNVALMNGFFISNTDPTIALKFLKREYKDD